MRGDLIRTLSTVGLALACLAPPLHAQTPNADRLGFVGLSVGAQVATVGASYENYGGVSSKLGVGALAQWVSGSRMGVGVSARYAAVGGQLYEEDDYWSLESKLWSVSVEPIYFLSAHKGAINSYVGLRGSLYRRRYYGDPREVIDPNTGEPALARDTVSAAGPAAGAFVGVRTDFPMGLSIQGSLVFDVVSLGNETVDSASTEGSADTFTVLSFALGVSFRLSSR
jgi:hypothetical protein